MDPLDRSLRDPSSGYASADVLDPEADVNRDHSQDGHGEELQDAMNGYASADVLDPADEINRHHTVQDEPPTARDPMSGYASADEVPTATGSAAAQAPRAPLQPPGPAPDA
jgi:hypothetical protein